MYVCMYVPLYENRAEKMSGRSPPLSFKLRVHVERLRVRSAHFSRATPAKKNRNRAGCDNLRECGRSEAISQKINRVRQIATVPYQYTHGHVRALIV